MAGLDRIIHSLHIHRTLGIYQSCFSTLDTKKNDFCHPVVRGSEWIMKDLKGRNKTGRISKGQSLWWSAVSCKLHSKLNPQGQKPCLSQNRISHGPEQYLPGKLRWKTRESKDGKPGGKKKPVHKKWWQGKWCERKRKPIRWGVAEAGAAKAARRS